MTNDEVVVPINWEEAKALQERFNADKDDHGEPCWSFDCNFKLDFDGPVIKISSRFSPPSRVYGGGWDGALKLYFGGKKIHVKHFECRTLTELRICVEAYTKKLCTRLEQHLKTFKFEE